MDNYRPQLFLRTADITVGLHWPEGTPDAAEKIVMPGDNVEMVCDLVHEAAAELGTRFTLREGGKTSKYPHSVTPTVFLTDARSWNWYRHQTPLDV
jgi:translation elongation factor EF-Tu-like GTPase